MLGALEAYQVDHGCYPAWANGARGANKFLKSSHESYAIPTFRVYAAKDEFFASLTTPTPYITSFPHDSFAPGGKSGVSYGYYTTGSCWLLFSAGRDMRYDIDPIKDFIPGGDNTILIMKTYDPTNGTYSAGDIFRMKLE
ncbi:MAG: hypothetical protein NTX50_04215 [Candidatus Sumerlaeota bacterium]|nr:hypothetical protein [Candidatus Sumerlaeota bacterium]